MHQMRDIDDRLQCDLGTIEGATAGGCARRELLGAALLAFLGGLGLVMVAGRLFEHRGDLVLQRLAHADLQYVRTLARRASC